MYLVIINFFNVYIFFVFALTGLDPLVALLGKILLQSGVKFINLFLFILILLVLESLLFVDPGLLLFNLNNSFLMLFELAELYGLFILLFQLVHLVELLSLLHLNLLLVNALFLLVQRLRFHYFVYNWFLNVLMVLTLFLSLKNLLLDSQFLLQSLLLRIQLSLHIGLNLLKHLLLLLFSLLLFLFNLVFLPSFLLLLHLPDELFCVLPLNLLLFFGLFF